MDDDADTAARPARRRRRLWKWWLAMTLALAAYASVALALHDRADAPAAWPLRVALLPGATSHGHHQIELACKACHSSPFGGGELLQQACTGCHAKALDAADDKHPARKFEDPRNAFRLEKIEATQCVTCHVEHRPRATRAMGVTQPADFCAHCHAGKDEMPPSHDGYAFDGCTACHNYHDNRALYEDYLLRHAKAPALLDKRVVPQRALREALQMSSSYPQDRYPFEPVAPARADAPAAWRSGDTANAHAQALDTTHARAGVNCSGCHQPAGADGAWILRPTTAQACEGCHRDEVQAFGRGHHGMRAASGLPPMTVADARLPMRADAAQRTLQCTSCHGAHRFDTGLDASVKACLGCHDDKHSRAYEGSPHQVLAEREARGEGPPGSGVTCATCHMPRERIDTDDGTRIAVQHDNSATLRPFSKMVRPVCQQCHGLGFALDALSDPALVARNFNGRPAATHRSIAMALDKSAAIAARRAASAASASAR